MFEEDFFEVEELQFETRNGNEIDRDLTFDVSKYMRALK